MINIILIKKKLILHKSTILYYYDYLKKNKINTQIKNNIDIKEYYIFDPKNKIKLPGNPILIESPNFLLTKKDYKEYNDSKKSENTCLRS